MKLIAYINYTPLPVLILLSAVLIIAAQQIFGFLPWMLTLAVIVVLSIRIKSLSDELHEKIDHPQPTYYPLHAPAVWSQLSKTIATTEAQFNNLNVSIKWDEWNPPPGVPINVQAIITIYEPELAAIRDFAPDLFPADKQSLRSKIVLNATVEDIEGQARLTLAYNTEYILFRFKHNQVIKYITNRIHELVQSLPAQ